MTAAQVYNYIEVGLWPAMGLVLAAYGLGRRGPARRDSLAAAAGVGGVGGAGWVGGRTPDGGGGPRGPALWEGGGGPGPARPGVPPGGGRPGAPRAGTSGTSGAMPTLAWACVLVGLLSMPTRVWAWHPNPTQRPHSFTARSLVTRLYVAGSVVGRVAGAVAGAVVADGVAGSAA